MQWNIRPLSLKPDFNAMSSQAQNLITIYFINQPSNDFSDQSQNKFRHNTSSEPNASGTTETKEWAISRQSLTLFYFYATKKKIPWLVKTNCFVLVCGMYFQSSRWAFPTDIWCVVTRRVLWTLPGQTSTLDIAYNRQYGYNSGIYHCERGQY